MDCQMADAMWGDLAKAARMWRISALSRTGTAQVRRPTSVTRGNHCWFSHIATRLFSSYTPHNYYNHNNYYYYNNNNYYYNNNYNQCWFSHIATRLLSSYITWQQTTTTTTTTTTVHKPCVGQSDGQSEWTLANMLCVSQRCCCTTDVAGRCMTPFFHHADHPHAPACTLRPPSPPPPPHQGHCMCGPTLQMCFQAVMSSVMLREIDTPLTTPCWSQNLKHSNNFPISKIRFTTSVFAWQYFPGQFPDFWPTL